MKPKYFINVNQDEPVSLVVSLMQRRNNRESDSHFIGFQIVKFDENQNKSQVCNQKLFDLINILLQCMFWVLELCADSCRPRTCADHAYFIYF